MSTQRIEQLEVCHREMFGDMVLTCQTPVRGVLPDRIIQPVSYPVNLRRSSADSVVKTSILENEKRRASALVDELLIDIYFSIHNSTTDYNSATSGKSHKNSWVEVVNLREKNVAELISIFNCLRNHTERMNSVLVRQLKRRDALRRQQEAYCDVITKQLAKRATEGTEMRFTIQPIPGESGFSQWAAAMKMVAQLPGGIPSEFRRRLWLNLAEKHLASRGVNWPSVERSCFSEWSHPADSELGVQIVKDLHRTGCSLFCGEGGQENQALLKRVLLAYARWNKAVGYCQGFNMLAALILQVTDKCESDALKLMIYLIEGVLPDSYFADSLRGLSVDMAVFRELLRSKLPRLSKHLDTLQNAAKDGSQSYEPPLTNVFTMQWFLTLFCNCLPQPTVLRVWDLILLEGNEILLRTALAIWQVLADRILSVRSADEFYCIMGVLTRELLEFDLVDGNSLIKAVVAIGPLSELKTLRDHYLYNINPWGATLPKVVVEKQLKLYPRQSIVLDISTLKKQYAKLKQRQRQAHIIFSAAISRQPSPTAPVTMNHLLLGKSALVPAKRIGPPKGAIPPVRQTPSTLYWKDAPKQSSSSSSSDTELCDEGESSDSSDEEEPKKKSQFDDNPPSDSDNILMINDNTISAKISASKTENVEVETKLLDLDVEIGNIASQNSLTENPEVGENSDNFDTASVNVKISAESDDESFDFERFLADRVQRLKEQRPLEEEPDERINYARRNSVRALQIIQENSLILHRILQCQSHLSPSPPLIHPADVTADLFNESTISPDFNRESRVLTEAVEFVSKQSKLDIHSHKDTLELDSEIDTQESYSIKQIQFEADIKTGRELQSPQYGSRYTSILEKSKSLDERYNALILNMPPHQQSLIEGQDTQSTAETIKDECLQEDQRFFTEMPLEQNIQKGFEYIADNSNITNLYKYECYIEKLNVEDSGEDLLDNVPELSQLNKSSKETEQNIDLSYPYFEKTVYCLEGEQKPTKDLLTSPDTQTASLFFKEDHTPTDEVKTYNGFSYNYFTNLKTDQSDSAISSIDTAAYSTNLVLAKSPEHTLLDLSDYKSKDSDLPSSCEDPDASGNYIGAPDEINVLAKYEEGSPLQTDVLSGSGSKTCYSYLQSPPEKQCEIISKTSARNNLCSKSEEKRSPTETEFDILEPSTEIKRLSGLSSEIDDTKRLEEPAKKSLTLPIGVHYGENSNTKSPIKSPLKSPLKSPNKAFNPFPVPLSSRQSKEVPIKLGLYKK